MICGSQLRESNPGIPLKRRHVYPLDHRGSLPAHLIVCDVRKHTHVLTSLNKRGLRDRVVKASRFNTTLPSALWFGFESHER